MSAPRSWAGRIPQIRKQVAASSDYLSRAEVQAIFRVKRSQADSIMSDAGAVIETFSGVRVKRIKRQMLLDYLQFGKSGQDADREQERQRRFAQQVAAMEQRHIEEPPLLVEAVPKSVARAIDRGGLDNPPAGIELAPGCITIRFAGAVDALDKLKRLALLIAMHESKFVEWADQLLSTERKAG